MKSAAVTTLQTPSLPKLHSHVNKHIYDLLEEVSAFSFTGDIKTSSVCPLSQIILTKQCIDNNSMLQMWGIIMQHWPSPLSHVVVFVPKAFLYTLLQCGQ